ncbi:Maf family protein [Devosia chinhatensis]|uniref:Nucleoside triphosphate pyrophosphatase n=1 Tax=Devosia chinhatensis TaxID=429727 RepID=A0A0F5FFY2_9HYPH|nr:Maf family protein [Devosia chinhatensis]KKB07809.1 septum formation inhibitor Maf [Devosia chinhatensis]
MLVLASTSATRKALLDKAGLRFDIVSPRLDERGLQADALAAGADGRDLALLLAQAKAEAGSRQRPDDVVIGADQTLALGRDLLHKPAGRDAARAQLERLRGKTHRLHAAVALARNGQAIWSTIETAELTMRAFTPSERDEVLDLEGDAILSSVGSYRLEGPSIRLFQTVNGDYFTILGLPLLPLLEALRDHAPQLLSPGN